MPPWLALAGLRLREAEEALFSSAGVLGQPRGGRRPQPSPVWPEDSAHSRLCPDPFYLCLVWVPWWRSWASLCPHAAKDALPAWAPEPSSPLVVPGPGPIPYLPSLSEGLRN